LCSNDFCITAESICNSKSVLRAFDSPEEDGIILGAEAFQDNSLDFFRYARGAAGSRGRSVGKRGKNSEGSISTSTTTEGTTTPRTTTVAYPPGYDKAPGWLKREIKERIESGQTAFLQNGQQGRSMEGDSSGGGKKSEADMSKT
jgi:hypothetical protein